MALSSLEAVAPHPHKAAIKFYIYLVSANCVACVCYFMIADHKDVYKYINRYADIDIYITYIYIYIHIYMYIYIYNKEAIKW